ncbi:MAG: hypothetical protein RTU30_07650 [Candidatus Thorarchaeota archaeon]
MSSSTDDIDLELSDSSPVSELVKRVAIAGVLAALSVAISPIAASLPRYGWGIAYMDPVSWFWIVAFLIGGIDVGLLSMTAGTVALFAFDPTGIGPFFKILATAPMIFIPWLAVELRGRKEGGKFLSRKGRFAALMALGYIGRLGLMIPMNLYLVPLFVPGIGILEIIIITTVLNAVQSVTDALVPFIVVFRTKLFDYFRMW